MENQEKQELERKPPYVDDMFSRRLDIHGEKISDLQAEFKAQKARQDASEARLDRAITEMMNNKAEIISILNEFKTEIIAQNNSLSEKIDTLNRSYYEHQGLERGRKENRDWRRFILPLAVSILGLMVALGWINGGNNVSGIGL